jgi:hypothetical protein
VTTAAQRNLLGEAMDLLVHYRDNLSYRQHRPMGTRPISTIPLLEAALKTGFSFDCSEDVTLICHVAGLKPPSGPSYPYLSGEGDTQTMYDFLPHYENPAEALVGALCFFGTPGMLVTQHITSVREPGEDPLLQSHGGNGSFCSHFVRLSEERKYHVGDPVFLSVAHL